MSYYTGIANNITDVRQSLINACTAEGWAWDNSSQVLSKDSLFLLLTISGVDLYATGRTSAGSGDMPRAVGVGRLWFRSGAPTFEISYPATYHIFIHVDEVYLIINYSSDRFQWLAFGKSTINNIPGTGMFVCGIRGTPSSAGGTPSAPISITPTDYGSGGLSAVIFGTNVIVSSTPQLNMGLNDYVHSDIQGDAWALGIANTDPPIGISSIRPLIDIQPSAWNSEAILMPIRAYKIRSSNRISLIADLEHARYIRVDNYEPGQIISLGDDDWMIFPFHRKNITSRAGGIQVDHTGTFGWAIRYIPSSS